MSHDPLLCVLYHDELDPKTATQNKPSLFEVAFVEYFVRTERQVTNKGGNVWKEIQDYNYQTYYFPVLQ